MVKIININTGKEVEQDPKVPDVECSICKSEFSIEEEGGTTGFFGMLMVAFCPFCLSSMLDMGRQMMDIEEDE